MHPLLTIALILTGIIVVGTLATWATDKLEAWINQEDDLPPPREYTDVVSSAAAREQTALAMMEDFSLRSDWCRTMAKMKARELLPGE